MRIDEELFCKCVENLTLAGGGEFDPCSEDTVVWCIQNGLPKELVQLFESHIPKTEVWAGAGVLFPELDLVKWNTEFPQGLRAQLLIIGSAANGDHIAVDLKDGSMGYISHEHDWPKQPRRYFTAVSPSIGSYLSEINSDPPLVPEDYWAAMKVKGAATKVTS